MPVTSNALPASADVVVVGAGLVGLAVAREALTRRPDARVVVLERGAAVAPHQSSHNSGVVHAGIYYAPGSLKARLAVEGAAALYEYCAARGVPARRSGKVVVATDRAQLAALDELERRGRANGVPDLRRVGPDGIREVEPHVRGVEALVSPHTGVVDYAAMAAALAEDVEAAGGTIHLGHEVTAVRPAASAGTGHGRGRGRDNTAAAVDFLTPERQEVDSCPREGGGGGGTAGGGSSTAGGGGSTAGGGTTGGGTTNGGGVSGGRRRTIEAGHVIVCAGAWSDVLAPGRDVRVVPFRGAYRTVRPQRAHLVRGLVYPVPEPDLPFLGVHLTRGVDDEVHVGPTALLVGARDAYRLRRVVGADVRHVLGWPGTWRMARRWWRTGVTELHHAVRPAALARAAAAFVEELEPADLIDGPAGVRGQAVARDGTLLDDFLVVREGAVLHVRNAPSPAATACLALAREIADRVGLT